MLDLTAALDTIDHHILLQTVEHLIGIKETALSPIYQIGFSLNMLMTNTLSYCYYFRTIIIAIIINATLHLYMGSALCINAFVRITSALLHIQAVVVFLLLILIIMSLTVLYLSCWFVVYPRVFSLVCHLFYTFMQQKPTFL